MSHGKFLKTSKNVIANERRQSVDIETNRVDISNYSNDGIDTSKQDRIVFSPPPIVPDVIPFVPH